MKYKPFDNQIKFEAMKECIPKMQNDILLNILDQNQTTSLIAFNKLSQENACVRLNEQAASADFIYRHIGESFNLFGTFFWIPTAVYNTTMGETDKGQGKNIAESKELIAQGYEMLKKII